MHYTSLDVAQDYAKFPGVCATALTHLIKPALFHPVHTNLTFLIPVQDSMSIFVKVNLYTLFHNISHGCHLGS